MRLNIQCIYTIYKLQYNTIHMQYYNIQYNLLKFDFADHICERYNIQYNLLKSSILLTMYMYVSVHSRKLPTNVSNRSESFFNAAICNHEEPLPFQTASNERQTFDFFLSTTVHSFFIFCLLSFIFFYLLRNVITAFVTRNVQF